MAPSGILKFNIILHYQLSSLLLSWLNNLSYFLPIFDLTTSTGISFRKYNNEDFELTVHINSKTDG
jgi:hypothetical protein